ncbi:MAG: hypothetical protein DWQ47_09940 [Acidobacteria bacterium]|nr:MAG: hypothetical protein DWQ32_12355 [Acidobacteriota bacterium]REJ98689.1 MAG: hypothetical protein DWQ38_15125 [Acidobacteriota bacterium]REK16655.1 MAG: hypothetical protein DWQ43_00200 [Acidobacteriota bacterium]REK42566.1 MAG: hypothetical protein DWQ47_09940 [Acidobacteriota bacterium]
MNKKTVVAAAFSMLLFAGFAFSQGGSADYSGKWSLDVSKSELGERSRIEAVDMTVEQTADTLSVERNPKIAESGSNAAGRPPGRGMLGGGKLTYSLAGKETKSSGGMGGEVSLRASTGDGGILKLTQVRSFNGPMGAISLTTIETWQLSADGKTLTVTSSTETPRGNRTQKMVFSRQ